MEKGTEIDAVRRMPLADFRTGWDIRCSSNQRDGPTGAGAHPLSVWNVAKQLGSDFGLGKGGDRALFTLAGSFCKAMTS